MRPLLPLAALLVAVSTPPAVALPPCRDAVSWSVGSWQLTRAVDAAWLGPAFSRRRAVHALVHVVAPSHEEQAAADAPWWRWQPAGCELAVASEATLCPPLLRLGASATDAETRGVLVLGDSTSHTFAVSLAAALNATLTPEWHAARPGGGGGVGGGAAAGAGAAAAAAAAAPHPRLTFRASACGGRVPLAFVRTDVLSTRLDGADERAGPGLGAGSLPWADAALVSRFAVVVVNSGAHFVPEAAYVGNLTLAATFLSSHVPHPRLLLHRATVPGHSRCWDLPRPFPAVAVAEAQIARAPYFTANWVLRQNSVAAGVFRTAAAGFQPLNVYAPSVVRGDAHVAGPGFDCQHFRLPGAVDLWVDAFALLVRLSAAAAPVAEAAAPDGAAAAAAAAAGSGGGAAAAATMDERVGA